MEELMSISSVHTNNCAPTSISAVTGIEYDVIWKFVNKNEQFCPKKGMRDSDIFSVLRYYGFEYCLAKGILKMVNISWSKWKREYMNTEKKYLVFFRNHVAAVVNGEVFDTAKLKGMAKINIVYEIKNI